MKAFTTRALRTISVLSAILRTGTLSFATVICVAAPFGAVGQQGDLERDMSEKAFEGAQWVLATKAARAVAQVGARAAAGNGALAALIRDRQELEDKLTHTQDALVAAIADTPSEVAELNAEIALLAKALERIDGVLRVDFPDYADISNPQPLDFASLQSLLGPGEGLLLFLSDRSATYVWAVSSVGALWHRAAIGADELTLQVRHLRSGLDPNAPTRAAASLSQPSDPTRPSFDRLAAFALYSSIIKPVEAVLSDVEHVFVVKDGALTSLPLSVLVTRPPKGRDDDPKALRSTAWLADRFAMTTLPGVSSLAAIRQNGAGEAQPKVSGFIGFGDPVFQGGEIRAEGANSLAHGTFQEDAEARAVIEDADYTRLPAVQKSGGEGPRVVGYVNQLEVLAGTRPA
ncbi:MAG: CHAT domain-containing protein, partial [Rhodobacteraceae bacterium]|nr:CHAT domain-containing protein [Paracoccaceae bacterium]